MTLNKEEVVRRQLGAALHLFLLDADSVSIHALACGGSEIADHLAKGTARGPLSAHLFKISPDLDRHKLHQLRTKYWNAFKHATQRDGPDRDDEDLFARFRDERNDHVLLLGWRDYFSAVGRLPIEAQVFEAWYYCVHPETLAPDYDQSVLEEVFPGIRELSRSDQKQRLRAKIEWAHSQRTIMEDPATEPPRALLLGAC